MTEKRFRLKSDMDWWFVCDGDKQIHSEEVVDLLNAQHETITKLRERLEIKDFALKKQLEITENQQKRIQELEK